MKIMVGMTATNALSERFEITSYRDGRMKMLQFSEGKKIADKESAIRNKERHGLVVAFKPSRIYLGADCILPESELDTWLTKLSFKMDPKLKIKYTNTSDAKDSSGSKVYKNTKGVGGFLEKFAPDANFLKSPLDITCATTILEENIPTRNENGEVILIDKMRNINIEFCINYDPEGQDTVRFSFVNNIETIEHGEHVNGCVNGYVNYMRKKIKDSNKKLDEEITNQDILTGLNIVVYMDTDYSSGLFTGQTKHKMDNRALYEPIRKMIGSALDEYFKLPENKKVMQRLIDIISNNVKARLAASKARVKIKRERKSFIDATMIDGYKPPNNIDEPNAYRELYIVEGDGAGGSARSGRYDPDTQGILGLVGKPSNVYGEDYATIEKSKRLGQDIKELFNDILGCGYGEHFSMENLLYEKIILMSDADIDGHHIAGLLVSDIFKHAPQLILEGKVYRAITPLYRLSFSSNKKNPGGVNIDSYLYSKSQYIDLYEENVSDHIRLKFNQNDDDFISKQNMRRFLETNRDYYQWLCSMASQYTLHSDIIEYMASHPDFRESISDFYYELKYDKERDRIYGVYDGRHWSRILNKVFLDKLAVLTEAIVRGNKGIYKYHAYKKHDKKTDLTYLGYLTIGQIMTECQAYEYKIVSRYKGLGELNKEEMHALAMDPSNRKLVRLTVDDIEEATNVMDDLFLKERRGARKKMLNEMNVSIDDIDN